MAHPHSLIAYPIDNTAKLTLRTGERERDWMAGDATYARRCLPLLIANQHGWTIHNTVPFRVWWSGGTARRDLKIMPTDRHNLPLVKSHFGNGILTFFLPYLFRTPPGWNLLIRGPANMPKDGASPLEGIVETDWSPASATMNWQITRPDLVVFFEPDEPIAMIVPTRRGELEHFEPRIRDLDEDRALKLEHTLWRRGRGDFLIQMEQPDSEASHQQWQRGYMRGTIGSTRAHEHQTQLHLRSFANQPLDQT
jgi:Family of unknown function (DUF6065)